MFRDDVLNYLKAGFPAIWVETHEEKRAEVELLSVAKAMKQPLFRWSVTQGWVGETAQQNKNVTAPIAALNTIHNAGQSQLPENCVLVMRDFHPFLNPQAPDVLRKIRDLIPVLKATGRLLVFLSPITNIPMELQKEITPLTFTLPTREELGVILDGVIEASGGKAMKVEDRIATLEAARGLTASEAENAFALAVVKHGGFPFVAIKTVRDEKASTIKKTGLVTWVEPSIDIAQIGGLGNLKKDLDHMSPIFHYPDKAEAFGFLPEDFPRSIALVGVPGTGKSMAAEAIPALLRVGCVQTDFGRIFGSKVGESEQNILRRNSLVESMAPVVDWWDEAEKGLAGASGNSTLNPWEARVGGSVLTWMESYRTRVLVVATINKHEALPPEMISRFQRVYFVDLPTEEERVEIFTLHLIKRQIKIDPVQIRALALEAKGFNGREIRNTIQAAMQMSFSAGHPVDYKTLSIALKTITPLSVTRAADIERIRSWAKDNNVRPASSSIETVQADDTRPRRIAVRPKENPSG